MWDWAIWGALIVATLAGVAALVLLAARTLTAWRIFTQTRGAVVCGLDELAARAEAIGEKVVVAGTTAELQASVRRLRVSLARLAVLRAALDEAGDTYGRVSAIVPHT